MQNVKSFKILLSPPSNCEKARFANTMTASRSNKRMGSLLFSIKDSQRSLELVRFIPTFSRDCSVTSVKNPVMLTICPSFSLDTVIIFTSKFFSVFTDDPCYKFLTITFSGYLKIIIKDF
jgi:hypothetical protein